jgi:hypothetical protein
MMKRFAILTALCGAALLLAGCRIPVGDDLVMTRDGNSPLVYITDYDLQNYVPIPSTGQTPVSAVNSRGDLEAAVIWKDQNGNVISGLTVFENQVYQAEITLIPRGGYGFSPSHAFGYHPGKITAQIDDMGEFTRIVTVTYNNAADAGIVFITDYNLQTYVPIPLAGEEPVRSLTRPGLAVNVTWDPSPAGPFVLGTVYRAAIRLTVENDTYRFFAGKNFAYPEGTVSIQPGSENDPDERNLTVTYLPARAPAAISDLDLTPYIPKPIDRAAAVMSFEREQYTGTVVWKNTGTGADLVGPFQADVEYTAEVSLIPAIGYSLNGVGQNTFTHIGAKSVTNQAGSGTVRLAFSPAGTGGVMVIGDTNLTNRISKPAYGVTPVTFIDGPQYTGRVAWTHTDTRAVLAGFFQSDTLYTAVVTLNAAPGYTFAGIGKNVFSHRDAAGIRNGAGSGTVTIDFPPEVFLNYTADRFGPASLAGSALKILMERSGDTRAVTIELSGAGEETVISNSANLIGGLTSPANVTIDGQGRKLRIDGPGTLLKVGEGVTLTLRDITLEGTDHNGSPLIEVRNRGKLILDAGARLTNNTTIAPAGGVWVKGGELVLNDGVVIEKMAVTSDVYSTGMLAGGVFIDNRGSFTMNGGLIGDDNPGDAIDNGNTVYTPYNVYGAGGVAIANGLFVMYGGTIQSNSGSGSDSSGGVAVLGEGTFLMYRGTITKNQGVKGGGVCNDRGTFTMVGAEAVISDNSIRKLSGGGGGGGVYNDQGTFIMNNGIIERNTAEWNYSGGGVCNVNATFIMNDGIIRENTAEGNQTGGGIRGGTFTMHNGTIEGNTAKGNESGGGVYVSPIFTMNNGTIQGNRVEGIDSGGGVHCYGAPFTMNNGIITGNSTQDTDSYGVFVYRWGSSLVTMTMKGPARVTADNPVFLSTTNTIIAIGGGLDNVPAATIKYASPVLGTRLLKASSFELITENIGKFQYVGGGNHIDADPTEDNGVWYGVYK